MRNSALLLIAAAAIAVPLVSPAQVSQDRPGAGTSRVLKGPARDVQREVNRPDLAEASKRIIAAINEFRGQQSLKPLQPDADLMKAARYFADFMARTDKYGHTADGAEPATRAKKFGYDYCIVAENIAYQFSSTGFTTEQLATRFFEGWQNSPGHRKNLLDPNVTETALAIASSAKTGHYYAVQLFGRPKSESMQFSVENRAGTAIEYSLDGQVFPLPPLVTRTHQRCIPSEIGFRGKTLRPANNQRLAVVNDRGELQLQAQ